MSIYPGLKKSEGRQESSHNCVCIHGYLQPQPFLERIYPQLAESDDGFVDRLLVCFPKTHILLEEVIMDYSVLIYKLLFSLQEVDEWCKKLQTFTLTSLQKPFELIAQWHSDEGENTYSFSEEGSVQYRAFANEMAQVINDQWESGLLNQGNLSKDKRTMIRYN